MGTVVPESNIPAWLAGFIDDAATFPPSNVPLDRAVAEHRDHRRSEYADLLGAFVVADVKVPDLIDVLDDTGEEREDRALEINLLVTGGAGAVGPAVRWATRAPHLRVRALEFALRDEDDLTHNARRLLTALDTLEEDLSEVEVYVELPRWQGTPSHGWLSALDEIAAADLRAKFRTGGADPEAVPDVAELAGSIDAALDRELPFRCTGGLVHPLTTPGSYGFLNVLLATRACLDGADVPAVLRETSGEALLDGSDPETLARTRRWCTTVGSSSLLESHDGLVELGLVTPT